MRDKRRLPKREGLSGREEHVNRQRVVVLVRGAQRRAAKGKSGARELRLRERHAGVMRGKMTVDDDDVVRGGLVRMRVDVLRRKNGETGQTGNRGERAQSVADSQRNHGGLLLRCATMVKFTPDFYDDVDMADLTYTSAHHVRVLLWLNNSKPVRRISCSIADVEWTNVRNGFLRSRRPKL